MNIENTWKDLLCEEMRKDYFLDIKFFLDREYLIKNIYPKKDLIFRAFNLCDFKDLKVVILGQDPYHGKGQANGLCFSVNDGIKYPPSLMNIFLEMQEDINIPIPQTGNLEKWSKQGVFLLNTILTVEDGKAGSHKDIGWDIFTDFVIEYISKEKEKVVFILWGNYAKSKKKLIDINKHFILESGHPSPMSANRGMWFGNKHFSTTNNFLIENNISKIDWKL